MKIIRIEKNSDINDLADDKLFSCGSVTTLGFFDGMHLAHRALIKEAKSVAKEQNLPVVVFTFSGNGNLIKSSSARLFTDEERLALIEKCDVDYTVIADFSVMKDMSAEDFVTEFLVGALNTQVGVCGFNFRFGKNAQSTSKTLSELMQKEGRRAVILDEYLYNGKTLSSTYIRELISENNLSEAGKLLGIPYFISGKVEHGMGLGRKLGIPTVNTDIPQGKLVPTFGVYLTALNLDGKIYKALTNVGSCPTFSEREAHIETYILDFNGDLYGKDIKIYFIAFLREEKKFSNEKELLMQINIDKNKAFELIGESEWQELGPNLQ